MRLKYDALNFIKCFFDIYKDIFFSLSFSSNWNLKSLFIMTNYIIYNDSLIMIFPASAYIFLAACRNVWEIVVKYLPIVIDWSFEIVVLSFLLYITWSYMMFHFCPWFIVLFYQHIMFILLLYDCFWSWVLFHLILKLLFQLPFLK